MDTPTSTPPASNTPLKSVSLECQATQTPPDQTMETLKVEEPMLNYPLDQKALVEMSGDELEKWHARVRTVAFQPQTLESVMQTPTGGAESSRTKKPKEPSLTATQAAELKDLFQ